MRKILLILILPIQLVFGQNETSLDSCYNWARNNYPNLKKSGSWSNITSLNKENFKTTYYPKVTLNGQVSYQTDVIEIDFPIPGATNPTVPKDQYKIYADLRQTIWDGGISEASSQLEEALLKSNLSELEVELYKLNEQVAQTFFTALVVKEQLNVLTEQKKVLTEKLKLVESGIKNGMLEKSSGLVIKAEILNIEQRELELDAVKNATYKMLSILTGKPELQNSTLIYNEPQAKFSATINRPEFQFFSSKTDELEMSKNVLSKTRNPKLFGFGQAGYGKPGLNVLNNSFDTYFLLGAGISWNAFDWKNTSRKKQIIEYNKEIIQFQKETFTQNIELLLAQQKEQIIKIEKMLEKDSEMVNLRTEITKAAASKLENEVITTSDYIQEMQNETIAKLSYELHKIQLSNAKEKYNIINGGNE